MTKRWRRWGTYRRLKRDAAATQKNRLNRKFKGVRKELGDKYVPFTTILDPQEAKPMACPLNCSLFKQCTNIGQEMSEIEMLGLKTASMDAPLPYGK